MKRLLVLVAAIASAMVCAWAEDLPPSSLAGLANGFTQTVRFTYAQTCRDEHGLDCDKGNGNPLVMDLGDGPEVAVDSSGNFVVLSSDGIWIVRPDGTAAKLAEGPARACQMSSPTSAVVTRMDIYSFLWNGPLKALFLTTSNEEITISFSQPNPNFCKDGGYSGSISAVLRMTRAIVQVDYPASGGDVAFNRLENQEPAQPSFGLTRRFSARITRRQPDSASFGPYLFRGARRSAVGTR